MPWAIVKAGCPDGKPWAVKKIDGGKVVGCHATEADAKQQLAALHANVSEPSARPLYRDGEPMEQTEIRGAGSFSPVGERGLEGYAAVFGTKTYIPELRAYERIQPGAFSAALAEDDIRLLLEHKVPPVFARNKSGTLRLWEDGKGLKVEADLNPDMPEARSLLAQVRRGDVSGMSFRFAVNPGGERWIEEDGTTVRELTSVRLAEVSVVAWPAYSDTTVAARSKQAWINEAARTETARRRHSLNRAYLGKDA